MAGAIFFVTLFSNGVTVTVRLEEAVFPLAEWGGLGMDMLNEGGTLLDSEVVMLNVGLETLNAEAVAIWLWCLLREWVGGGGGGGGGGIGMTGGVATRAPASAVSMTSSSNSPSRSIALTFFGENC